MKKFFLPIITALILIVGTAGMTNTALASEYGTIFGGNNYDYSGWIALEMKSGLILNDDLGVFFGTKGGLLINQTFTIGLGAYGLLPFQRVHRKDNIDIDIDIDKTPYAHMGYGGLYLEYIVSPRNAVNVSISCLLGGGSIGYSYDFVNDSEGYYKDHVGDPILIAEPGLAVGFNITKWMKVELGGSYKFITAIEEEGDLLSPDNFRNFTGNIGFKFGWFGSSQEFNEAVD